MTNIIKIQFDRSEFSLMQDLLEEMPVSTLAEQKVYQSALTLLMEHPERAGGFCGSKAASGYFNDRIAIRVLHPENYGSSEKAIAIRVAYLQAIFLFLQKRGVFACEAEWDEALLLKKLRKREISFLRIERHLLTKKLCLAAIESSAGHLWSIPPFLRDEDVYEAALRKEGSLFEKISENLRTYRLCLAAVRKYGPALKEVPLALQTDEIYLNAVRQCGQALQFVPKERRSHRICLEAAIEDSYALCYVPQDIMSDSIAGVAVRRNGLVLRYVPTALRTKAICKLAVRQDGLALVSVPPELRTVAVCRAALLQDLTSYIKEFLT